jgi:drug/metabolite transporter superfamily protein YnfA
VAPNEIDLTARTRTARVLLAIGYVLALLVAAGCLASFVAGPEEMAVRLIAGAAGLLIVLAFVWAVAVRRRRPSRLVVDHEGVRVLDGRGRKLVRLAWTELSGVGVMTNEFARARKRLADALTGVLPVLGRGMLGVPIWLELFPSDAEAVARHPELDRWWKLGTATPPGEAQRWLVLIGDGRGQEFPIGEAVQRWRPDLWRGHRSGSLLLGGHAAWLEQFARQDRRPERGGGIG